ncbi:Helix-turn-helix [Prauserella marina]|uniref:Helix-turn-helix n=1 Tax=Prauserella marina TaxID=530584 RepID=A0A1G6LPL2_9PSEU|nr:helix-turn-helix protein [Prauserella marina]SDC45054.1 Helix-turn-helix [Prauserella marina]
MRTERGLTLDELAARSGVSRRVLSYAEGGLINPGILSFVAIVRALGIDSAELLQPMMDEMEKQAVQEQAPG